jgi:hypothetical protein
VQLLVSLTSLIVAAQSGPAVRTQPADYPFGVGERLEYSAKLGMLKLGEASLHVVGIENVRGQQAFRFRFLLEGGNFLFRIKNTLESWTTVNGFRSLRFHNDNTENDTRRLRQYEIFPDSGFYRQAGKPESRPTPPNPVDDAAMLYFVRTASLEVGQTYRFNNYFEKEKNPLLVRVLKREKMNLPDGTSVDCLVLNPVIDDRGMFADRADARLWITDDALRIPVQIRSKYPFGAVTLKLEKITPGTGAM